MDLEVSVDKYSITFDYINTIDKIQDFPLFTPVVVEKYQSDLLIKNIIDWKVSTRPWIYEVLTFPDADICIIKRLK